MSMYDCIVVGSGHAGSCAALSAKEHVLMVDKCPAEWVGGNGYFTAGAHRTVHSGVDDLLSIVRNVTPEQAQVIDMEPYTREEFVEDIMRLGARRSDPSLVAALVDNSRQALTWLAQKAQVPFILSFHRQAFEVNGRQRFWGGLVTSVEDGGKGLIRAHQAALKDAGVEIWFDCPVFDLVKRDGRVAGVVVRKDGLEVQIESHAVVLAAGGFEANSELRVAHLGQSWDKAKIRGTPYNTGDCFAMAQSAGAKLTGDWSSCHSTCWDWNAPSLAGARDLTNQYTKSGYPLGIMINAHGLRFVDEGEDYRNYTYAKDLQFGKAILLQPGGFAFQIWDTKALGYLRKEEYGDEVVEKIYAGSVEELAHKLSAIGLQNGAQLIETLRTYNQGVKEHMSEHPELKWDPAVKDGLSTESSSTSLSPPKSNWALKIDEPPFVAVKVTCGITFTFGGLAIDPNSAAVLSESTGAPIPGLFCTGEMVGNLFWSNYPGGSGLTAGAVFGRKAGESAWKCIPKMN
ncbi:hypothetical protein D9757_003437 [Collybiopsis confluens]|uniref:FAD-dependent oxidoreductase 2 FAD-binding domain-containing protein n=1 Tax=Collybiopsis confluens TaxID=2823264 RepID=A0A8H5HTW9_9AGAR|nr:hypothetical protein D9757_003437 [Collybiopsis confluens]